MAPNRMLRDRVAGQSDMFDVVSAQQFATPQSAIARFLGITPLTMQARARYRGALGELLVGDILENLGHRWDALHELPLEHGSLDHLAIGPAGVFTVRTANCNGVDVVVNGDALIAVGETRDDIILARAEADEVSDILSDAAGRPIAVTPLLVIVNPRRLVVKSQARDVTIVTSSDLEKFFTSAPQALSGDDVAFLSDVADLQTTWPTADATVLDTQQLHRDFSVIRAQVGTALVRRIMWAAAATTFVYISVCSIIALFVSIVME